jgi:hypothetical protein
MLRSICLVQMVMQAKLDRRRRRQGETGDRAESSTPLHDRPGTDASLQSIPPPSEPVHADVKTTVSKGASNGPALTPVPSHAAEAAHWHTPHNGAGIEQTDPRIQPPAVAEDKGEVKSNPAVQKGFDNLILCDQNVMRELCNNGRKRLSWLYVAVVKSLHVITHTFSLGGPLAVHSINCRYSTNRLFPSFLARN